MSSNNEAPARTPASQNSISTLVNFAIRILNLRSNDIDFNYDCTQQKDAEKKTD